MESTYSQSFSFSFDGAGPAEGDEGRQLLEEQIICILNDDEVDPVAT